MDELPVMPDEDIGRFIEVDRDNTGRENKFINDIDTTESLDLLLDKISHINKKLKLDAVDNGYVVQPTTIDRLRYRLSVCNFQLENILNEINKI